MRCSDLRVSVSPWFVTSQPRKDAALQDRWVEIRETALDVGQVLRFVADPRAGGVDVFLGTTRAETGAAGRELVALDYEAYPGMALARMQDLAARAAARWPVVKLALLHRVGRVALAEPSVVVAVATPHRADAFEACRWLIDTLKAEVPVWKKEVWADGSTSWVAGTSVADDRAAGSRGS